MAPSTPQFADTAAVEPSLRHEALAEWLEEVTGVEIDLKTVQLVSSLGNDFRGTEADAAWKVRAEEAKSQGIVEKRQAAADAMFAKRKAIAQEKLDNAETKTQRIMAQAKLDALEEERVDRLAQIAEGAPVRRRRTETADEPAVVEPSAPPKKAAVKRAAAKKPAASVTDIGAGGRTKRAPAKKSTRKAASPVVPSDDDF